MSQKNKGTLGFQRYLKPSESGEEHLQILTFEIEVTAEIEEDEHVVTCPALETMVAGVGSSPYEALNDFVDGFKALVDHHIRRKQLYRFLELVGAGELRESEQATPSIPPWMITSRTDFNYAS